MIRVHLLVAFAVVLLWSVLSIWWLSPASRSNPFMVAISSLKEASVLPYLTPRAYYDVANIAARNTEAQILEIAWLQALIDRHHEQLEVAGVVRECSDQQAQYFVEV